MWLAETLIGDAADELAGDSHAEGEVGREDGFEAGAETVEGGICREVYVAAGGLLGGLGEYESGGREKIEEGKERR